MGVDVLGEDILGVDISEPTPMIHRILHSYSCIIELLNSLEKTDKMLGKASHLIFFPDSFNTVIHEHSCKIYVRDANKILFTTNMHFYCKWGLFTRTIQS